MIKGTPLSGLSLIATRVYVTGSPLTLVAYTNTRDSLTANSLAADLAQPTLTGGYAPILLNGAWTVLDGVATYQHPVGTNTDAIGNPQFVCTGPWSASVTGIAMIFGTALVHFKDSTDLTGTPLDFVAAVGKRYSVSVPNLVTP